jgi:hypothetical protein
MVSCEERTFKGLFLTKVGEAEPLMVQPLPEWSVVGPQQSEVKGGWWWSLTLPAGATLGRDHHLGYYCSWSLTMTTTMTMTMTVKPRVALVTRTRGQADVVVVTK